MLLSSSLSFPSSSSLQLHIIIAATIVIIVVAVITIADINVVVFCLKTNFAARKQQIFSPRVKNIFASRTQILRPKHMFPSLATLGNTTRNTVSATMFLSLARPLFTIVAINHH